MAYLNGSATSSTDLLQQLVTFLVANGWTQDRSASEGSGWTASLHKSGNYAHLRARENEAAFQQHTSGTAYGIDLYLGTGFSSGQPWNNQTTGAPIGSGAAYPVGAGMYLSVGPFTNFYFMTDSSVDNVVVVVERTPGLFVFIGWGLSIQTAGSFTGGPYFFGSSSGFFNNVTAPTLGAIGYLTTSGCPGTATDGEGFPCTYVRADVDSFTGKWISISGNTTASNGYTGKVGSSSVKLAGFTGLSNFPVYALTDSAPEFQQQQTSVQDSRANLLPVMLWVNRDGTSTGYSLLGTLPLAFASNGVGHGFSNASEYVIGANTYKMFPNFAVQKVV